jgi:hypothetical protein
VIAILSGDEFAQDPEGTLVSGLPESPYRPIAIAQAM